MANDRAQIQEFLQEQFSAVEESGEVAIVGLVHIAHSGPAELHAMKKGHGKWGNAEEMAATFDSIATRHARGIVGGGLQQFEIRIVRGAGGIPTTVLPFMRTAPMGHGIGTQGSLATEPPTELGLRQQAQRWGEQITQMTFSQIEKVFQALNKIIEGLQSRVAESETTNRELWLACKTLLLELDKKRHSEKLAELSAARMAEFQKQAMTLAPALINMMAGKEVFPLSAADSATLDTIAAFATPDDVRMLTAGLAAKPGGAEIAAVLAERFENYHKRKASEAQAEKKMLAEVAGGPERSYEEADRDAAGVAIHALKGQAPPMELELPKLNAKATAEVLQATDVSIPSSEEGPPEDTRLLDELFESVQPGQIGMLVSVLGAENPKLAERLKARWEQTQK